MKRQASMVCRSAGAIGILNLWVRVGHDGRTKQHEAHEARVKIVTDRYSGLEVEFVSPHGSYKKGERLIVGRDDFISQSAVDRIRKQIIETFNGVASSVVAGGRRR